MTDAQEPRCKQAENDGNDRPSERASGRPERTEARDGGREGAWDDERCVSLSQRWRRGAEED